MEGKDLTFASRASHHNTSMYVTLKFNNNTAVLLDIEKAFGTKAPWLLL
jgi:hypothetical protein